jgi:hypothetical protein
MPLLEWMNLARGHTGPHTRNKRRHLDRARRPLTGNDGKSEWHSSGAVAYAVRTATWARATDSNS